MIGINVNKDMNDKKYKSEESWKMSGWKISVFASVQSCKYIKQNDKNVMGRRQKAKYFTSGDA